MRHPAPGPGTPSVLALCAPALPGLCALALLACRPGGDDPSGESPACPAALEDAIELADLEAHLHALADLGTTHAGTRVAGSSGYDASADYATARLLAAGLTVHREVFQFDDYELHSTPKLKQVAPATHDYAHGVEFRVASFSGDGDVEGPVIPIDLSLEAGEKSTSGCQPDDFADFRPHSIALLQRGGCYHQQKIDNAVAAGAAAVVYINQGHSDTFRGLFTPRLSPTTPIPVVTLPHALGAALAGDRSAPPVVRVVVSGDPVVRTTTNVIGETPATASGRVIMLGAHLDSVAAGPGINDNGSGVAAVLGVAGALSQCALQHQVRLALWGAEEYGLLGSTHYIQGLGDDERAKIALYINLDMIASPNPVRFIYDGDGSAWDKAGPDGSAAIEAAFSSYFADLGLPTRETPFDGRSDYWAFINQGIAAGGLFTGAEDRKTSSEVAVFGGEADVAYDPCYHAACDDADNYDPEVLLDNTRAAAHVIETFATRDPPLPPADSTMAPRTRLSVRPAPPCEHLE